MGVFLILGSIGYQHYSHWRNRRLFLQAQFGLQNDATNFEKNVQAPSVCQILVRHWWQHLRGCQGREWFYLSRKSPPREASDAEPSRNKILPCQVLTVVMKAYTGCLRCGIMKDAVIATSSLSVCGATCCRLVSTSISNLDNCPYRKLLCFSSSDSWMDVLFHTNQLHS